MRRTLLIAGVLAAAAVARASAPATTSTPVTATDKFAVPFIEDDYPRALSEARAKKVPIFVENWAPW